MKAVLVIVALGWFVTMANASETVAGVKKDYQNFKQEMSTQLEQAEQNLEALRAKSKDKITTTQKATVEELQSTKEKLRIELENMKTESVKASKKVKSDLAASISSLNEKIQKALKD